MAVYTMELRTILQQTWLDMNPTGTLEQLEQISPLDLCNAVWNKIFWFDFPVWSTITKQELCVQILMFYYMREIGQETVALWKQCLWVRMMGIMPYFTQLAEAQISMGKIFETQNITESIIRKGTEDNSTKENNTSTLTQESTGTQDTVNNNTVNSKSFFSDTPQSGLQDVANGTYMTNATVDSSEETGSNKVDVENTQTSSAQSGKVGDYLKDYDENVSRETSGYNGNKVQILKQYQETLQAIPLMIIEKLADLFIGIL